jgi:hypothetical protein
VLFRRSRATLSSSLRVALMFVGGFAVVDTDVDIVSQLRARIALKRLGVVNVRRTWK